MWQTPHQQLSVSCHLSERRFLLKIKIKNTTYSWWEERFHLFSFDCAGSSFLCVGFLWFQWGGATLRCGVWASHHGGFSCFGAQALSERASVAVAHGLSGSVSCGIVSDQGLNLCALAGIFFVYCATREVSETLSDISCKEASNLQSLHHIWLWDLSSLTRCWTQALGSKRGESSPLDHQGIPCFVFF